MAAPLVSSDPARSTDSATAAEQVAELMAELQHRDQLVEVLTERLEEAAEQLDRVHRSGAMRSGGGGSAASTSEVLERLGGLSDGLEQVTSEWQEVQAGELLLRIDARLDRLIEVLRNNGGDEASPVPENTADETSYAAQVAAMYASAAGEPVAPEVSPAEPEEAVELAKAPSAIAETETNPEVLHTGLHERDDYISYLIRELHHRTPRAPLDWVALQACPDELVETVKLLELQLQAELQREELHLSLERARMARERAELDRIRARLDREIRALGRGQAQAPGNSPAPVTEESSPEPAGLFRLFGRKR